MKSFAKISRALLLGFALAAASAANAGILTDYAENKIVDWLFRGQSFTPPATLYVRLNTTSCSDSASGTEVVGSVGYARVAVVGSLANWAGTQSAGSTTASSGTGGTTSNNGTITFGTPSGSWGQIQSIELMDASTSGNSLFCIALTAFKNVNNGDPAPTFPAASLSVQIDN